MKPKPAIVNYRRFFTFNIYVTHYFEKSNRYGFANHKTSTLI